MSYAVLDTFCWPSNDWPLFYHLVIFILEEQTIPEVKVAHNADLAANRNIPSRCYGDPQVYRWIRFPTHNLLDLLTALTDRLFSWVL